MESGMASLSGFFTNSSTVGDGGNKKLRLMTDQKDSSNLIGTTPGLFLHCPPVSSSAPSAAPLHQIQGLSVIQRGPQQVFCGSHNPVIDDIAKSKTT